MLNAFLIRFRQNPVQTTVLSVVLLIHFLFIAVILISPALAFQKKEHKPLIVKTIAPKPVHKTTTMEKKNPRSNPASVAAAKPQAAPAKQESPQPQKIKEEPKHIAPQTPKPTAIKKETLKSMPAVKKEPAIADKTISKSKTPPVKKNSPPPERAKISDSLMKQLEESIAKIETKADKGAESKSATVSSKSIAPIQLQIDSLDDSNGDDGASDYADSLASHLHRSLSLPEYGEVKIQLSLRQDGSVVKLIVLKTQSEKNKQYLESNLPRLRFPRFDGVYASKKEHTFILTFCNE